MRLASRSRASCSKAYIEPIFAEERTMRIALETVHIRSVSRTSHRVAKGTEIRHAMHAPAVFQLAGSANTKCSAIVRLKVEAAAILGLRGKAQVLVGFGF